MPARVPLITRVQTLLADANRTLAAVASESMGGAGRAILAALLAGHTAPQALAGVAQGRLRRKRDLLANAWEGRMKPPHRCGWTELVSQLDRLDETSARCDARIQAICGPGDEAVGLLDPMPGVARHTADMLVAALGTDRRRFPRADHRAAWAGVAPGTSERAGHRAAAKTRTGHRCLRTTLGQAAHAATPTNGTSLSAPYRRLATRRGQKRALLAVAHAMLVMASDMLQRQEPDCAAGADFFDRLPPEDTARRLVKRLESRGDHVTLRSPSPDAMTSPCRYFHVSIIASSIIVGEVFAAYFSSPCAATGQRLLTTASMSSHGTTNVSSPDRFTRWAILRGVTWKAAMPSPTRARTPASVSHRTGDGTPGGGGTYGAMTRRNSPRI